MSMQFKKVAIIKNGIDIGRVIPFNRDTEEYDFKISFIQNDYEVNMYPFLSKAPKKFEMEKMVDWEISYHRSTAFKPTIIHLKEKKKNPKYRPLPLYRLVDPTIHTEFPIPFMRLEIPLNFAGKNYKLKSKEHVVLDMDNSNVAEIYLTHSNFHYETFSQKWPALSLKLIAHSFEFFATNNMLTNEQKYKNFIPMNGEVGVAAEEFGINEDMKLYVNKYTNPEFTDGKIRVTLIENEFAEALLGLSLVGYANDKGKVEMFPAFEEDLRRETMSRKEKQKWEYRFNKMQEKLERAMKNINNNRNLGPFL